MGKVDMPLDLSKINETHLFYYNCFLDQVLKKLHCKKCIIRFALNLEKGSFCHKLTFRGCGYIIQSTKTVLT